MAHKTLIGGTAYEISGGKPLVNGTAYSIDKGKTLVGGTAYEVGFAEMVTVTIKGGNEEDCYVCTEQSGTKYYNTTLEVPAGTVLHCCAVAPNNGLHGASVYLNSNYVGWYPEGIDYEYTVTGNTRINCYINSYGGNAIGSIYIAEELEGYVIVEVEKIDSSYAEFDIGSYTNAESGLYVQPIGFITNCFVDPGAVYVNGNLVYSSSKYGEYCYTLAQNITVIVNAVDDEGLITITETT